MCNAYKSYNLLVLLPLAQKQFQYSIHTHYVAITKNGMYITCAMADEILS